MRRAVIGVVAVGSLVSLFLGLALAQAKKPDATLKLTEGTVAVGIGFSWGKGTLAYKGKNYPVKVEGLSVGEVGVNRATAVGNVRNLKQLADFDGNYVAAGAEATVGGRGRRDGHEESERGGHRAEEHDPGSQPQAGGRGAQAQRHEVSVSPGGGLRPPPKTSAQSRDSAISDEIS